MAKQQKGTVTVVFGINRLENVKLEGRTVSQVRGKLAQALNIPNDIEVLVGGEKVSGNRQIKANETLEFVKLAGQKG